MEHCRPISAESTAELVIVLSRIKLQQVGLHIRYMFGLPSRSLRILLGCHLKHQVVMPRPILHLHRKYSTDTLQRRTARQLVIHVARSAPAHTTSRSTQPYFFKSRSRSIDFRARSAPFSDPAPGAPAPLTCPTATGLFHFTVSHVKPRPCCQRISIFGGSVFCWRRSLFLEEVDFVGGGMYSFGGSVFLLEEVIIVGGGRFYWRRRVWFLE